MSNFAFLPQRFKEIADYARRAEKAVYADRRISCFHARFTLETLVHWLYRHDAGLRMPYDDSLGSLLHEPTFLNLLPQTLFQKARAIQKMGNQAVHNPRPVETADVLQLVKELHHICYWLTRTYAPDASRDGAAWKDERVPRPLRAADIVPRKKLEELEARLIRQSEETLRQRQESDAKDAELQALREELARVRAAGTAVPDPHDYSEAQTRRYLIDVDLRRAGWPLLDAREREYEVTGMPNAKGLGYAVTFSGATTGNRSGWWKRRKPPSIRPPENSRRSSTPTASNACTAGAR